MMKETLKAIRRPVQETKRNAILKAICSLTAGIVLGVIAKWLDQLALDSGIWWHRIIEGLDLGNFFSDIAVWLLIALAIAVFSCSAWLAALKVFSFFAGMCLAYHLYSIVFAGFNPSSYMMRWYAITLLSPLLAVLCWYAKGKSAVSIILDIGIFAVFSLSCFAIGLIYVDLKGILYLLVFAAAIAVLFSSPKQTAISLPVGFLLAFLFIPIWPFK